MATKQIKETVTTVETDGKDRELEAASADELTSEEEELQQALGEVGDTEVKIQVIRTLPADKAGNCTSYPAGEFSIDRLREEWGGGKYMLYFRLPGGKLKTKRSISVLEKLKPAAPPDRTAELIAALAANKGDNGAILPAIFSMMQAQQKSSTDMIVAMINAQGNNKAAGMGPAELVALLGAIEGLKGKADKSSGSSLDELVKVLKVARELNGEGGDSGGILDKLATMAGPLIERLAEKSNAAQTSQISRRSVPVSATIVSRETAASSAKSETSDQTTPSRSMGESNRAESEGDIVGENSQGENMNLKLVGWLRETLALLLKQAEKNSDPELYADYVLDNLPDGITADVVLAQLRDPDAMTKLQFFDGRVATHRDWLEEFQSAVIERIEEAQEQERQRMERVRRAQESTAPTPADDSPAPGPNPYKIEAGNEASGDGM